MENFWKNKRVIILGGNGFIGKNFVTALEKKQAKVYFTARKKKNTNKTNFIKLDPTRIEDFSQLKEKYDVLINCAALDGNGYFKSQFAVDVCDTNTRISLNVLKYAHKNKIADVVMFSSAEVYSDIKKHKVQEDDLKKVNLKINNGYKIAKLYLENITNLYAIKNQDMRFYLPRPSYVYGYGDKYIDEKNSRLIPMLIHNIKNNKKFSFFGGKSRKINLIYIEDLVSSVLLMIEKKKTGILNITSSELLSIFKIVNIIAEQLNKKAKISFERTNLRPGFLMNNDELLKIKHDFTTFKEGINQTLKRTYYD